MIKKVLIEGISVDVYEYKTVVVGSGAAAFNAADSLHKLGQTDIALVTDGINKGTSRNTGSDKQTYYKQSTSIRDEDSPLKVAKTLFDGGAMHGDIALVEGALSLKSFYKLIEIGMPFPHDEYGQYVGYMTDHDENSRASSVGPLTSKVMTEKLEEQVRKNGTDLFDSYQVIAILKDEDKDEAVGILAIHTKNINEENYGLTLFNCTNIVYGTGGPASAYYRSVFPVSQNGATGVALEAGAKANNMTEWQYGMSSIKFRWNLSGTYQQVIPRYVSTDQEMGDEREFLEDFFENPTDLLDATFLKGYQWPFDARKLAENGSSIIDLLVYIETQIKDRRVFLDFNANPKSADKNGDLDFDLLGEEAYRYLKNSDAFLKKPIDRLKKMNPLAIELYRDHNIDIEKEYLELDVCAQHQNGGLVGNIWWESNIKHLFPVGEANGTLGIYRPGGTALNSTQVGSYRAAEFIKSEYDYSPLPGEEFINVTRDQIKKKLDFINSITIDENKDSNVKETREKIQKKMSKAGAFIRDKEKAQELLGELKEIFSNLTEFIHIKSPREIPKAFQIYDMLITQIALLSATLEYIDKGGSSRGSYLVTSDSGDYKFVHDDFNITYGVDKDFRDKICETVRNRDSEDIDFINQWVDVRPIPEYDSWFENVWRDYREKKIYKRWNEDENKKGF